MRRLTTTTTAAFVAAVLVAPAAAAAPHVPDTITLTSEATEGTGFRAEGVVASGSTAYAGSLATGTIVTADLRTGEVRTLVDAADGPAVGLALDGDRLWVAGGPTGTARVYDTSSGALLEELVLTAPFAGFINDVAVTDDAAYLTDSFGAALHRVPIEDGEIGTPEAIELAGDFALAPGFNGNGIVATGDRVVFAQSTDPLDGVGSALYLVEDAPTAATFEAERIAFDDGDVTNADGLVLRGRTLYVVENAVNRIAVVDLSADLTRAAVTGYLTDDDFSTPTTATLARGDLYAVNARFGDLGAGADPTTLDFDIVRVDLAG